MDYNDESLAQYGWDRESYQGWRKVHTQMFGDIFASAFEENPEAQVMLTAALTKISERDFDGAMPRLDQLETLCTNEFDEAAVCYFKGLNHELLDNEQEMNEYYETVREADMSFVYPLSFHPYYRTAKFAQRASEYHKAVFYYRKALAFYHDGDTAAKAKPVISQIIYDIATCFLTLHRYDDCERFLALSEKYHAGDNPQRDYVKAVLFAVRGEKDACHQLLKGMNPLLAGNCKAITEGILWGRDPHYCVVPQDRSEFSSFWETMVSRKDGIEELIDEEETDCAEELIAKMLTELFGFMKRNLECRIETSDGELTVYCKTYCVKTLACEYEALFSEKPAALENWHFVSVNGFEDSYYNG